MVPGSHGNYASRSDIQAEEREEWMKNARVRQGKGEMFQVEGMSFGKNFQGGSGMWMVCKNKTCIYNSMVRYICVQNKLKLFIAVWS